MVIGSAACGENSQILGRRPPICLSVGWGAAAAVAPSLAPILNDVFLSMSLIKSLADTAAAARASEGRRRGIESCDDEEEEKVVFLKST